MRAVRARNYNTLKYGSRQFNDVVPLSKKQHIPGAAFTNVTYVIFRRTYRELNRAFDELLTGILSGSTALPAKDPRGPRVTPEAMLCTPARHSTFPSV